MKKSPFLHLQIAQPSSWAGLSLNLTPLIKSELSCPAIAPAASLAELLAQAYCGTKNSALGSGQSFLELLGHNLKEDGRHQEVLDHPGVGRELGLVSGPFVSAAPGSV